MDQLLVDVGDAPVEAGDEVVFIGRQGDEEVTAPEWAHRLETIPYEIVTGIGARTCPRLGGGAEVGRRTWRRGTELKRTGVVAGVAAGVIGAAAMAGSVPA